LDVVLQPSEEITERAKKKNYEEEDKFLISPCRGMGILIGNKLPFQPIVYLGTLVFKKKEIKKVNYYQLGQTIYSGGHILETLSLLRNRRVRVYVHMTDSSGYGPLLFGTTKGTVAFAPITKGPDYSLLLRGKLVIPMESVVKKVTDRFRRGLVFALTT